MSPGLFPPAGLHASGLSAVKRESWHAVPKSWDARASEPAISDRYAFDRPPLPLHLAEAQGSMVIVYPSIKEKRANDGP